MRVLEPITVNGNFWLSSKVDSKLPGTLSIHDGGKSSLEVIGSFFGFTEILSNAAGEIPRICGEVEKYGYVTLERCLAENLGFDSSGPRRNRFYVSCVFLRVAYEDGEVIEFNKFFFSVDSLDQWHLTTGIRVENDLEHSSTTIRYSPPAEIVLWKGKGVEVRIKYSWRFPASAAISNAEVSQKSYIQIEYSEPVGVLVFAELVHKFAHFFTLAMNRAASISEVQARSPHLVRDYGAGRTQPIDVSIYFESLSFSERVSTVALSESLFLLSEMNGQQQLALDRWLSLHEKVGPGMNLFFSAIGDAHKYLNVRFLWLAQALETFHRRTSSQTTMPESEFALLKWAVVEATSPPFKDFVRGRLFYGNEPSLAWRLKAIVCRLEKTFGSVEENKKFVRAIVDTRNYYTHFDESLKDRVADGIELWNLCQRMEILFKFLMLDEMGFTEEMIQRIVDRNYKLQRALAVHK